MRPLRLVMEGFLAYRERTEVDFSDADLFVLSGPTGSGKSSVIDGMTFALYGTIPRLDDRRSVAPVISAQADQARVSFEFAVGEDSYTAVRLVQRTKTGATTTEARLQRGRREETLAGNAEEVTAEVTRLLGLSYEHFTKAVVLPQGEFADFLGDKPSERQALLRALLEVGLFEQVMRLANARAGTARAKSESIEERLARFEVPTDAQLTEARRRLTVATEAGKELPARMETLRRLEASVAEAQSARSGLADSLARLESITTPDHLQSIDQDRSAATERLLAAGETLAGNVDEGEQLEKALAGQPGLQQLGSWQTDRSRLDELMTDRAGLDLAGLGEIVEKASAALDEARRSLDTVRVAHAAHELRIGLASGDPCPVCHVVIVTIPVDGGSPDESLQRQSDDLRELEIQATECRDRLKEAEGQSKQIDQRIIEMEARLDSAPAPDVMATAIGEVTELVDRRAANEKAQESARAEMEAALLVQRELEDRATGLRESLLAARDRVAADEPPIPGDDVIDGWRVFDAWRLDLMARRKGEHDDLSAMLEEATAALSLALSELQTWLDDRGIESTGSPEADVRVAAERRRVELETLEKALADVVELRAELDVESGKGRVASALGNHLKSNNFEAWLLEEALETLVEGANRLLDELSSGAYSLQVRKSQFEVVDHRNARLTRTTKSLSGGETFLVALSLALSMADQLAALTGNRSRLESVFLDEGFGSLDQESIDVVANVLDELVGNGRTVGIVTHVRELAERIPVRFEVSKGPETASIARL